LPEEKEKACVWIRPTQAFLLFRLYSF